MRATSFLCLSLAAGILPANGADPTPPANDKEHQSYATGVDLIRRFEQMDADIDVAALVRGIEDAAAHRPLALGEKDLQTMAATFKAELELRRNVALQRAAETNLKAGDAFRAEFARQSGVVTLPSGLMYRVLAAGKGRKPDTEDTVECRYDGRLIDGRSFDHTAGDLPVPMQLKSLIPGWREALSLMPVGAKYDFVMPPALAYGERGNARGIGPNVTLVYEIELTAIK